MAKDTFFFSHDYNARNDDKIKKLIRKHGMVGYGVFWSIVEELYNNANALRTDYEGIAYDLRTDEIIIKSIINDFELFENDGEYFGSKSIERRLEERSIKSTKARQSAFNRWRNNANALESDANAPKSDAIKDRKGKDRKGNNSMVFDFEKTKTEFFNSGKWHDLIMIADNRIKNIETLTYYLNEFLNTQNAADYFPVTLSESKNYFVRWLKKQNDIKTIDKPGSKEVSRLMKTL